MRRVGWLVAIALLSVPSDAWARKRATERPALPPVYRSLDAKGRADWLARVHVIVPIPTRLKEASTPFLGTPYGISPLGEGAGSDPDPRLRYDLVDCLTFVETTMALAFAPDEAAVLPVLDDLRYGARPSFDERNHFVEAQWVPHNLQKGWIRDISDEVAGRAVRTVTKTYGADRWLRRQRFAELFSIDSEFMPRGAYSLSMVPLDYAAAHVRRFPSGSIVFVVRMDLSSQPTRVTHVGFVFDTPSGKVFRHASKSPYMRVVDEPLGHFFQRNAGYAKWPVEGVAVFEPRWPQERLERLLHPVVDPVGVIPEPRP